MADFFTDPKAPQMVRMLRKLAEGPKPMRAFTYHAEVAPRHAIVLRDRMFYYGIAAFDKEGTEDGREKVVMATQVGLDLLKHIEGAGPIFLRAKKRPADGG